MKPILKTQQTLQDHILEHCPELNELRSTYKLNMMLLKELEQSLEKKTNECNKLENFNQSSLEWLTNKS